jgi:hypothetical protein
LECKASALHISAQRDTRADNEKYVNQHCHREWLRSETQACAPKSAHIKQGSSEVINGIESEVRHGKFTAGV